MNRYTVLLIITLLAGCGPPSLTGPPAGPAAVTSVVGATTTTGPVRPRSDLTPGRAAPASAKNGTADKLCAPGFSTKTVRPSSSKARKLETNRLAAYGLPTDDAAHDAYELDHLISLGLGGDPTDLANLWPEPWEPDRAHPTGPAAPGTGAQTKDRVEVWLMHEVCAGRMPLSAAQAGEAADWTQYLPAAQATAGDNDE